MPRRSSPEKVQSGISPAISSEHQLPEENGFEVAASSQDSFCQSFGRHLAPSSVVGAQQKASKLSIGKDQLSKDLVTPGCFHEVQICLMHPIRKNEVRSIAWLVVSTVGN